MANFVNSGLDPRFTFFAMVLNKNHSLWLSVSASIIDRRLICVRMGLLFDDRSIERGIPDLQVFDPRTEAYFALSQARKLMRS